MGRFFTRIGLGQVLAQDAQAQQNDASHQAEDAHHGSPAVGGMGPDQFTDRQDNDGKEGNEGEEHPP